MNINYNNIITTLKKTIAESDNKNIKDDLKMAIEIVEAYEQSNEKAARKFNPIVDYETNVIIDRGTNNYSQIRANFKGLAEKYTNEKLKIQLERIDVELKLHLHKHECLQAEKEAIEWVIEKRNREYN